ncbi:unnamed protein product [Blepharisma stoltei]|uniref:Succinyl-CoA:3-ketoacid-coenzyme A transferase n=1 Tax=Blepharisma stoltei TaxID=1481888 RepID=A0AAU9K1V0_9CILI|nr:unnamed protein product [Blepharisma stoltei]
MLRLSNLSRRFLMTKIYSNPIEAIQDINTGTSIAIGGYGCCGVPENLIQALRDYGNYDFTVYSMGCGAPGYGIDLLLESNQLKRVITSYLGSSTLIEDQYYQGVIELKLVPEGTLIERIRAGGSGIPGFWTRTGVGTVIEEGGFPLKYKPGGKGIQIISDGKERRLFDGQEHLFEESIRTDFSLVKAWKADTRGNLIYKNTAMNFNPEVAMCSKVTIAEVEEIVEEGELDPDQIHTPGIFVHRLIKGEKYIKPFEYVYHPSSEDKTQVDNYDLRARIAKRVIKELTDGMYVTLGLGIPSLIPDFLPPDLKIRIHSVSGALGVGPSPRNGNRNPDLVNSNREPITILPGGSTFSSCVSLNMLRGGHMDAVVVPGFQVSKHGDLANWIIPGKIIKGMGSAMDAVIHEQSKVIVTMLHAHEGIPRIVKECTLPITAKKCVDLLVTEHGVFDFNREDEITLIEIAKGSTLSHIKDITGCAFTVSSDLKEMQQ